MKFVETIKKWSWQILAVLFGYGRLEALIGVVVPEHLGERDELVVLVGTSNRNQEGYGFSGLDV